MPVEFKKQGKVQIEVGSAETHVLNYGHAPGHPLFAGNKTTKYPETAEGAGELYMKLHDGTMQPLSEVKNKVAQKQAMKGLLELSKSLTALGMATMEASEVAEKFAEGLNISNLTNIDIAQIVIAHGGHIDGDPPVVYIDAEDMFSMLHVYENKLQALVEHCPEPECQTCATIMCPLNDAMHYHHDGCPSCAQEKVDAALSASAQEWADSIQPKSDELEGVTVKWNGPFTSEGKPINKIQFPAQKVKPTPWPTPQDGGDTEV